MTAQAIFRHTTTNLEPFRSPEYGKIFSRLTGTTAAYVSP